MHAAPNVLRSVADPVPNTSESVFAIQNFAIAIESLDPAPFVPLFALDESQLMARGMRRMTAPSDPGIGYPCRVSLAFAAPEEELLLVNHRHLGRSTTPYRAEGPVFVRRHAQRFLRPDDFPEIIMQREMAVRAYDAEGMMVEADLAAKDDLVHLTREWLGRPEVVHVDFHSARRGCFFCRARRA